MVDDTAVVAAAATIHEDSFSLEHLSVSELEFLQVRVLAALVKKMQEQIPLLKWEYEVPDDRSYGSLSFEAQTTHGILRFEGQIGSDGSMSDDEVRLFKNAEDEGLNVGDNWNGWGDALNNCSQNEAKLIVLHELVDWQEGYEPAEYEPE